MLRQMPSPSLGLRRPMATKVHMPPTLGPSHAALHMDHAKQTPSSCLQAWC